MTGQAGFWDVDERVVQLSKAGDPLEWLNRSGAVEDVPQAAGEGPEAVRFHQGWPASV